jgi:hypothetical protein
MLTAPAVAEAEVDAAPPVARAQTLLVEARALEPRAKAAVAAAAGWVVVVALEAARGREAEAEEAEEVEAAEAEDRAVAAAAAGEVEEVAAAAVVAVVVGVTVEVVQEVAEEAGGATVGPEAAVARGATAGQEAVAAEEGAMDPVAAMAAQAVVGTALAAAAAAEMAGQEVGAATVVLAAAARRPEEVHSQAAALKQAGVRKQAAAPRLEAVHKRVVAHRQEEVPKQEEELRRGVPVPVAAVRVVVPTGAERILPCRRAVVGRGGKARCLSTLPMWTSQKVKPSLGRTRPGADLTSIIRAATVRGPINAPARSAVESVSSGSPTACTFHALTLVSATHGTLQGPGLWGLRVASVRTWVTATSFPSI